jgi:uncharacterized membrane protein
LDADLGATFPAAAFLNPGLVDNFTAGCLVEYDFLVKTPLDDIFLTDGLVLLIMFRIYYSMDAGNDLDPAPPEPELFSAVLTPHRSLSNAQFTMLMGVVSVISFAAGLVFWHMGAWPVFGFFGLDVLLVYWAFKINFRRAKAIEQISVTPSELRVRRVSHRGHVVEWVLNPLWVQLDQKTHAEFGIERLYLVSKGRRVSIASFLGPDEKASFAKALQAALQAARRGPIYNPIT